MIRRDDHGSIIVTLPDGTEGVPAEVKPGPLWPDYVPPKCSACDRATWMPRDEMLDAVTVRFVTIDGAEHVHRYIRAGA